MKTCLQNRYLKLLVNKPTHKHNHIFDWIIVRDDDELVCNIDVVDKCLSDHYVISFNINMAKTKVIKHVKLPRPNNNVVALSACGERLT